MNKRSIAVAVAKHPIIKKLLEARLVESSTISRLILEEIVSDLEEAMTDDEKKVNSKVRNLLSRNLKDDDSAWKQALKDAKNGKLAISGFENLSDELKNFALQKFYSAKRTKDKLAAFRKQGEDLLPKIQTKTSAEEPATTKFSLGGGGGFAVELERFLDSEFHKKVVGTGNDNLIKGFEFIYKTMFDRGLIKEGEKEAQALSKVLKLLRKSAPEQYKAVEDYLKVPENAKEFTDLFPSRTQNTPSSKSPDKKANISAQDLQIQNLKKILDSKEELDLKDEDLRRVIILTYGALTGQKQLAEAITQDSAQGALDGLKKAVGDYISDKEASGVFEALKRSITILYKYYTESQTTDQAPADDQKAIDQEAPAPLATQPDAQLTQQSKQSKEPIIKGEFVMDKSSVDKYAEQLEEFQRKFLNVRTLLEQSQILGPYFTTIKMLSGRSNPELAPAYTRSLQEQQGSKLNRDIVNTSNVIIKHLDKIEEAIEEFRESAMAGTLGSNKLYLKYGEGNPKKFLMKLLKVVVKDMNFLDALFEKAIPNEDNAEYKFDESLNEEEEPEMSTDQIIDLVEEVHQIVSEEGEKLKAILVNTITGEERPVQEQTASDRSAQDQAEEIYQQLSRIKGFFPTISPFNNEYGFDDVTRDFTNVVKGLHGLVSQINRYSKTNETITVPLAKSIRQKIRDIKAYIGNVFGVSEAGKNASNVGSLSDTGKGKDYDYSNVKRLELKDDSYEITKYNFSDKPPEDQKSLPPEDQKSLPPDEKPADDSAETEAEKEADEEKQDEAAKTYAGLKPDQQEDLKEQVAYEVRQFFGTLSEMVDQPYWLSGSDDDNTTQREQYGPQYDLQYVYDNLSEKMRRIEDPSSGYQMNVGAERQYANLDDLVGLENLDLPSADQKEQRITLNGLVSTRNNPIKSINLAQFVEGFEVESQVLEVTIKTQGEDKPRIIKFESKLPEEGDPRSEPKVSATGRTGENVDPQKLVDAMGTSIQPTPNSTLGKAFSSFKKSLDRSSLEEQIEQKLQPIVERMLNG
jgi:hypothetical protein